MERGIIAVFLLCIFIFFVTLAKSETISGYATSQSVNVSIQISGVPLVNIVFPENTSYTSHITALNYTASAITLDTCWYSLNNGQTNTTVVCGQNITGITSSEGSNTWKVYANNSEGTGNNSVTFTVTISGGGTTGAGTDGGGGGGGGGTTGAKPKESVSIKKDFIILPEEFNLVIIAGEKIGYKIEIVNPTVVEMNVSMSISGINDFLELSAKEISLKSKEKKTLEFNVSSPDSGIYAGKIIFSSGDIKRETFIIINVRSSDSLFDVSLTVPGSYRVIKPGQDMRTFISLTQLGEAEKTDVSINYLIKDFDGNVLYAESETFAVAKSKSFVKEFPTSEFPIGEYIVGVEVNYPEGFATSSAHFSISEEKINLWLIAFIILAAITTLAIILAILNYKKHSQLKTRGKK